MADKEKKRNNYALKMKKANEKIRRKRGFWELFIPRLIITFLALGIIGTAVIVYERSEQFELSIKGIEKQGENITNIFLEQPEYKLGGSKYLNVLHADELEQWTTAIKNMDRVLPVFMDETGYWGVYDYKNETWLTEYSEDNFMLPLIYREKYGDFTNNNQISHKDAEYKDINYYGKTEETVHSYTLIEEQKNAIRKYMEMTSNMRLSSNVYISSGYVKGTKLAIEKYRIGENGTDVKMELGDMTGWEHFIIDIVDKSDYSEDDYDKLRYWKGISYNYGYIGDHEIASRGCLINSSCYVINYGDEMPPLSGKVDTQLKETAKKYLDELVNETCDDTVTTLHTANASDVKHDSGVTYDRLWTRAVINDGDNIYGLVYTCYYESRYIRELFIFIIVLVIMGTGLISLLWTRYTYLKFKMQREMYEYRAMLTNTMAHDLKSPLMAISGYTDNILENTNPNKNEYYIREIAKKTSYMNGLIENILELSKSEELVVNKKEQLDIANVLREVQTTFEEKLKEKGLSVSVEGNKVLNCDKTAMTTVLRNLFENAVKYSDDNGIITVLLSDEKIVFENPCEKLGTDTDKIFDAYVKDDTSRTGTKGNGLGLAIVKSICDAHGYKVTAEYKDGLFTISIVA